MTSRRPTVSTCGAIDPRTLTIGGHLHVAELGAWVGRQSGLERSGGDMTVQRPNDGRGHAHRGVGRRGRSRRGRAARLARMGVVAATVLGAMAVLSDIIPPEAG